MSTFVYLHGFMSAGKSKKAEDFRKFLGESHPDCRFLAPDIPDDPVRAYRFVTDLLDGIGDDLTGLIGSSLGGFWARVSAERLSVPAVLINPVVNPAPLLVNFLGSHKNPYTGNEFVIEKEHAAFLSSLAGSRNEVSRPELFLLILGTGDEVLDYTMSESYFRKSEKIIVPGGSHRLPEFGHLTGKAFSFLEWKSRERAA